MPLTKKLEKLSKKCLPPSMCLLAKRLAVPIRYRAQAKRCRQGFREHGQKYPQKVLFVAGLPKSGTTWLENMIKSFPGFSDLLIPDVAKFEAKTGGSHDYELPEDMFSRFRDMLVLTKMHVHGSQHNVDVLREAGVRYVVMFRDLRDVAVSHFYYVNQTPWHAEYPVYAKTTLQEGLAEFARRTLPEYAEWVRSWHARRDPERSLVVRYEQMLKDAVGPMKQVSELFQLGASDELIANIVEANSFKRLSGGRKRGQADNKSFFRSGTSGGWAKHFTPELKDLYKEVIGDFLIEFDYEHDMSC